MSIKINTNELQLILNTINSLPDASGGGEVVLQSKTATPSTTQQTIVPDIGYDGLFQVVVNAMPTVTQATPAISINSSGLITASATQSAGYVIAGTKSATKQLAFQAARTITPGTTNQIAVSSGYYTGGDIIVKGDSNLVAENIKSGVSIFGISGTLSGNSSGGNTDIEDAFVTKTLSTYTNNRVKFIGSYAFYYCSNLTSINFPACRTIYSAAFYRCTNLTSISFPACTAIYSTAFYGCSNLTSINFPACTTIYQSAFRDCTQLTSINFPVCTTIRSSAFYGCSNLTSIYLLNSTICHLDSSMVFYGTNIGVNKGSIFVPASLVASYKAKSNWSYFSNRIFSYMDSHDGGIVE